MEEIAPRRDNHSTRWLWQASIANDLKEGYGQSTTGRIASHDDVAGLDRTMSSSFWWSYKEEIFKKIISQSEIPSCRKGGTNRTQEGLVERKGTDTEEQVESWVLQSS